MTKEELLNTIDDLVNNRGYFKNFKDGELDKILSESKDGYWTYLYKVIERIEQEDEGTRASNMLIFRIWSLEKYKERVNSEHLYSLQPIVMISRNTSERIDLNLQYPEFSIDELEEIAAKFGKFCDENVKIVES